MEPGNLVAQEKSSEMKKMIAAADRGAKFKDYLKKADANYEKNNVKIAFLYLVEALRVYPEGKSDVQSRLRIIAREYPQELAGDLERKIGAIEGYPPPDRFPPGTKAETQPEPEPEARGRNQAASGEKTGVRRSRS